MPEALRLQGIKKALHEVLSSEENSSCRAFCCALFFSEFREIGKRKQQFLRAVGGIGELNLRTGLIAFGDVGHRNDHTVTELGVMHLVSHGEAPLVGSAFLAGGN